MILKLAMISNSETPKRALVIYDTRYGKMERIARSFERGLEQTGLATSCLNVTEVNPESLKEYDLIAIGGPTEKITASEPIKKFLAKMERVDGKFGFAFDIKLSYPLTGSAAKFIEKKLKNLGFEIVLESASAIVIPQKKRESDPEKYFEEYFPLREGEERRFEDIGKQVGTLLLTRRPLIRA